MKRTKACCQWLFTSLTRGKQSICLGKYIMRTEIRHLWGMFVTFRTFVTNKIIGHSQNTHHHLSMGPLSATSGNVTSTGRSEVARSGQQWLNIYDVDKIWKRTFVTNGQSFWFFTSGLKKLNTEMPPAKTLIAFSARLICKYEQQRSAMNAMADSSRRSLSLPEFWTMSVTYIQCIFNFVFWGVWNDTLGLQIDWILKLLYSVVKWCSSCEEQFSWLGAVFSWNPTTHVVPLSGSRFSSIFVKYFRFNPPFGDQSYQFF